MRAYEARASLLNLRPVIAVLPGVFFGMTATVIAASVMASFPWLPGASRSGTPLPIQIALVIGGAIALIFLVPAQIRMLLRELFGRYIIETDAIGLRIRFSYAGMHGSKAFLWSEIQDFGLCRVGIPPCDAIRIDPSRGYWFSFGVFFDRRTRYEILDHIRHGYREFHPTLSSNAA